VEEILHQERFDERHDGKRHVAWIVRPYVSALDPLRKHVGEYGAQVIRVLPNIAGKRLVLVHEERCLKDDDHGVAA